MPATVPALKRFGQSTQDVGLERWNGDLQIGILAGHF
jgi:hypothetical protein